MASNVLANLLLRVRGDTRGAQDALGGLNRKTVSLTKAFAAMAGAAAMGFAIKRTFDLGAAVAETASKFETVFGPATASVQEFIDDFGEMAGLSGEAAQSILATTGAIAQGMGFAQEASAKFAKQAVRLAGDLASFNNVPVADTARAIEAAITGERESLKRLGVVILETDVQKRALVMTGKESAKALTQEEKAAATLVLITERAGVAIGDLERTQNSAANTAKRLGARWQNLKEIAATALLPAMEDLLVAFDRQTESLTGEGGLPTAIKNVGQFFRELVIQVQLAISTFDVIDKTLNLFFAQVASGFRNIARGIGFDLTDNVRIAELALNNARMAAAELTEELLLGLNAALNDTGEASNKVSRRLDGITATIGRTTPAARTMKLALVDASAGFNLMVGATERATAALRTYNDEVSLASRLSSKLGKIAGLLGLFGGGGGTGAFVGKAASFFSFFDDGGTIGGGQVGIVGERGPELVRGPATVTSRAKTAHLLAGHAAAPAAPNVVFNQTVIFDISAIDGASVAAMIEEQKGNIVAVVAEAAQSSAAFRRTMAGG